MLIVGFLRLEFKAYDTKSNSILERTGSTLKISFSDPYSCYLMLCNKPPQKLL